MCTFFNATRSGSQKKGDMWKNQGKYRLINKKKEKKNNKNQSLRCSF